MNRFKKEEARKKIEARGGLSALEIERLDQVEAMDAEINKIAIEIHIKRFPEEYDHIYDSIADASDRTSGKNPMNAEYIANVAARRAEAGVTPLDETGMPVSDDSWDVAYAEAEERVRDS